MTRIVAFLLPLALLPCSPAPATEPLHDLISMEGKTGLLLPEKCCWVGLPPSEALDKAMLAELGACSAIGGPVGKFALNGEALTLISLDTCSGEVPLARIYPTLKGPIPAKWVSGEFRALLDPLCQDPRGVTVYGANVKLAVQAGRVVKAESEPRDASACSEP